MKGFDRPAGRDRPDGSPDRPRFSESGRDVPAASGIRWEPGRITREDAFRQRDEYVARLDRARKMEQEVTLPEKARDSPQAIDVMPPNFHQYEVDRRKFSEYSLNPGHKQNNGKAEGWRALGYDVDDPRARAAAADDLAEMSRVMLPHGRVVKIDETPFGRRHQVMSGFIGPNGAHGTLISCWIKDDSGSAPKMTTAWMQPHRDKGDAR